MNDPPGNPFWHKLTLESAAAIPEALVTCLFDQGAVGLEEQDTRLIAYFSEAADIDAVSQNLLDTIDWCRKELGLTASIRLSGDRTENEDWHQNWKQYFKPIRIASRLLITPSWEKQSPPGDLIPIIIDPQQAFGTGGHETTQLMLTELVGAVQPGMRVLDAGTGSGILAIAAAKLGADRIHAFDHEAIAVATAVENARRNGVRDRIRFVVADRVPFGSRVDLFDLVLANMLTKNLLLVLPGLSALVGIRGQVVLSGLLEEEKDRFIPALAEFNLAVIDEARAGEWLCLRCTRGPF